MTTAELSVIVHYSYSPNPYPILSEVVTKAIQDFLDKGILVCDSDQADGCYSLTAKGRYFLDHILATPLPEVFFRMPQGDQSSGDQ